jgi:hypothetical protein
MAEAADSVQTDDHLFVVGGVRKIVVGATRLRDELVPCPEFVPLPAGIVEELVEHQHCTRRKPISDQLQNCSG